ncbi:MULTISPECIES: hypothetical protein [Acinetobacter calcoaceticus/baumannii complex]|uniref:hypothetical protein n=1 Tax=Acinetobacter calcoaceticus/baumannii complex TaxID=909768 RepID=UPI001356589F|nr:MULTISPECIES: hypothetical protein [Acinetobacter calcoaceticus/baumannii complex]
MCYFYLIRCSMEKRKRVFTVESVRRLNQMLRDNPGITAEDIPLSAEGRKVVRNFKPDMEAVNAAFNKAMQGL